MNMPSFVPTANPTIPSGLYPALDTVKNNHSVLELPGTVTDSADSVVTDNSPLFYIDSKDCIIPSFKASHILENPAFIYLKSVRITRIVYCKCSILWSGYRYLPGVSRNRGKHL